MSTIIKGIYRDGKVELAEAPTNVPEETRVIVTFLDDTSVDLQSRGIDEAQASDLRTRLATFSDEWESPEMKVYDNYDAKKTSR